MFEITFLMMFIFITVLWVVTRCIVIFKSGKFDIKREAKLLLVYTCLVVIARFVYFPLQRIDGHIGVLEFDGSRIFPFKTNLIPFTFVVDRYDGWQINIIGNIAMFIPVGIVWPVCFDELKRINKAILAGAGFTLLIELSQLLFYDRCSDIDDTILNTAGICIGALIYFKATSPRIKKPAKS